MKQHRQEGMVLPPMMLSTSVGRGDSQGVSRVETRPFPCGPGDNGAYFEEIEMTPAFQTMLLWIIGAMLIVIAPFFIACLLAMLIAGVPVYFLLNLAMRITDS